MAQRRAATDPLTSLQELTVAFRDGDIEKVVELDRCVLAVSPAWATIAYLAADVTDTGHGPARVVLRRYRRQGSRHVLDKHFTLTSAAQGQALADALQKWLVGPLQGSSPATPADD
jgi:hypothetical protein